MRAGVLGGSGPFVWSLLMAGIAAAHYPAGGPVILPRRRFLLLPSLTGRELFCGLAVESRPFIIGDDYGRCTAMPQMRLSGRYLGRLRATLRRNGRGVYSGAGGFRRLRGLAWVSRPRLSELRSRVARGSARGGETLEGAPALFLLPSPTGRSPIDTISRPAPRFAPAQPPRGFRRRYAASLEA
jgi:hypothetical protein